MASVVRDRGVRAAVLAVGSCLLLAACASGNSTQVSSTTASAAPAAVIDYQLLADGYAAESGSAIDPMMFVSSPGTPGGEGPLSVVHVAGVTPVAKSAPAATMLVGADGSPLGITLGQWLKAAGTVSFSCVAGQEQATSTLTGLIPNGTYSVFVVHTDVDGPGRFTPWDDAGGTKNTFTASSDGTASTTDTLNGCSGNDEDIVVIWHSDGAAHGQSPGTIGIDWHTSLISSAPF